jgi:hypothetical protein
MVSTAYKFGPSGAYFSSPIMMTLKYDPTKLTSGFPVVAYYDVTKGQWITLGGVVNNDAHTVTVQVNHFTIFAVMQDLLTNVSPAQKSNASLFVIIALIFFIVIVTIVFLITKRRGKTSI